MIVVALVIKVESKRKEGAVAMIVPSTERRSNDYWVSEG